MKWGRFFLRTSTSATARLTLKSVLGPGESGLVRVFSADSGANAIEMICRFVDLIVLIALSMDRLPVVISSFSTIRVLLLLMRLLHERKLSI